MQINKENLRGKSVLIIGPPASGKTTLAANIMEPGVLVFHTDDYMAFGYKEALYVLLDDLKKLPARPIIIEGVQGYRLLRKGLELGCYYPDVVIELQISKTRQIEIYNLERDPQKLKYLEGFDRMHQKILADYFTLQLNSPENKRPEWIKTELHTK